MEAVVGGGRKAKVSKEIEYPHAGTMLFIRRYANLERYRKMCWNMTKVLHIQYVPNHFKKHNIAYNAALIACWAI